MSIKPNIYLAIDSCEDSNIIDAALDMGCGIKIGHPVLAHFIRDTKVLSRLISGNLFLDLKLYDIPNSVIKGIDSYKTLLNNPSIITVHSLCGIDNLSKIVSATQDETTSIAAVTIITSISSVKEIGIPESVQNAVQNLAELVHQSKAKYIVCSASESRAIKSRFPKLKTIIPGIRLGAIEADDQQRTSSLEEARAAGDILVLGRAVTQSNNPIAELDRIMLLASPKD